MKILAVERELTNASPAAFRLHAEAEARRVWELQQADIIREIYFTPDTCAIIILECPDIEQARDALNTLPYVREGLICFELTPLSPYSGYNRLMTVPEI